jgi:hypothetical protein
MPIDLKKIQNITAAAEAKAAAEAEEQRIKVATWLYEEAQQREIDLLQKMHQQADEAIRVLPQVIEEAAHNRKRSAIVYTIPAGCVPGPTHYKLFFRW